MQILKEIKPFKIIPVTVGLMFLVGLNTILIMPTLYTLLIPDHPMIYQVVAIHPIILMGLIMFWTIRRVIRSNKNV